MDMRVFILIGTGNTFHKEQCISVLPKTRYRGFLPHDSLFRRRGSAPHPQEPYPPTSSRRTSPYQWWTGSGLRVVDQHDVHARSCQPRRELTRGDYIRLKSAFEAPPGPTLDLILSWEEIWEEDARLD